MIDDLYLEALLSSAAYVDWSADDLDIEVALTNRGVRGVKGVGLI